MIARLDTSPATKTAVNFITHCLMEFILAWLPACLPALIS